MKRNVVEDIFLTIRPEFVLRRLGHSRLRPPPDPIFNRITGTITEARALLEPKAVYIDTEISTKNPVSSEIELDGGFILPGTSIFRLLKDCYYATVFVGTVGRDITDESLNRAEEGRPDESFYLDTIGSEAAEELARVLHKWTHHRAKRQRESLTARFSPGYGDLPLAVQPDLLDYVHADEIGVTCSEAFMLSPRKSISGIIGWHSKN